MTTLAAHCRRVNRLKACQEAWDNMSDPAYENDSWQDDEEIIDTEDGNEDEE